MINKDVISLSTKEFLGNLKNFFDKYFGDDAQKNRFNGVSARG